MAQCNSMMLQLMFEQDQRFYIWCDALISTNKATDDDVTIPINDAQFWSTMLQTTMVLWIWSMMSRMTMMFQSCSTMLRTMIMLLNLVQRMKTRFKDINTWFKKWRGNQRKSKCKEKKWAQLQLFRTTVSGITTNITLKSRVWIHVMPWWEHRVLSQWLKLADNASCPG